jgi:fructoselysine-6-P-deglycase FrlB-like protein
MSFAAEEIASQPACWTRAAELAPDVAGALPQPGERVAIVGCGTSFYMAQSCAALRESAGAGETDAFAASEFPAGRSYDRLIALTRSGTTTEVLRVLERWSGPSTVITTDPGHPVARHADAVVSLDFADERSVVQTRFATTALALWRAHVGTDLTKAIADAEAAVSAPVDALWLQRTQFTYLGTGWTIGLASEAALKVREAAQAWAESYAAMEFRHGPISVISSASLVWFFGEAPVGLVDELAPTGGLIETSSMDPMAHLVVAQRLAVELAEARGLDPDAPRNLTRSIVLAGS